MIGSRNLHHTHIKRTRGDERDTNSRCCIGLGHDSDILPARWLGHPRYQWSGVFDTRLGSLRWLELERTMTTIAQDREGRDGIAARRKFRLGAMSNAEERK